MAWAIHEVRLGDPMIPSGLELYQIGTFTQTSDIMRLSNSPDFIPTQLGVHLLKSNVFPLLLGELH